LLLQQTKENKPHLKQERGKQAMDHLALGAMGSLLPKLGELLKEEYKMQTSVKRDVEAFSGELRSMRAALQRVAVVPRDQLDEEVRLWAGDVRELSYDTEDVVDSLLVRVKGSGAGADMDGLKEIVGKMKMLFKKGKARRQIATAIKDIKDQVQGVAARHDRYKADGVFVNLAAATKITAVDPLLVALYEDRQRIVGIDNTRDELIEKLCLTDASKQPKILSIVGFGGLGKTTLAKAVYDEIRLKFDCAAFVSVSRSPDLKKVFKDLLFEVDYEKYKSLSGATLDERQLIDQLQKSLGTKRYPNFCGCLIFTHKLVSAKTYYMLNLMERCWIKLGSRLGIIHGKTEVQNAVDGHGYPNVYLSISSPAV
jgi:predicted AAA+ superfamily ATPase